MNKQIHFMQACGQSTTLVNFKQVELYMELIREEAVRELFPALLAWLDEPLSKERLIEVLDGLGDTLVVVHGLAYSLGLDPNVIKERIDESNLSKISVDGVIKRRSDGKILKDMAVFKEPVLDDLAQIVINKIGGMK